MNEQILHLIGSIWLNEQIVRSINPVWVNEQIPHLISSVWVYMVIWKITTVDQFCMGEHGNMNRYYTWSIPYGWTWWYEHILHLNMVMWSNTTRDHQFRMSVHGDMNRYYTWSAQYGWTWWHERAIHLIIACLPGAYLWPTSRLPAPTHSRPAMTCHPLSWRLFRDIHFWCLFIPVKTKTL